MENFMLNSRVLLARKAVYSAGRMGAFAILLAGLVLLWDNSNGGGARQPATHHPIEITGLAEPISSPDGRFELLWRRNENRGVHEIWVRLSRNPARTWLAYSFDRGASVLWSPSGEMIAVTDRSDSNETRVRVLRVFEDRPPSDLASVARYVQRSFEDEKGKLLFGHSYATAVGWSSDSKMLEVEIRAYDALDGSGRSLNKLLMVEISPVKRSD